MQRPERRDEVRRKEEDNCRKKENDEALFPKRKEKRERRRTFLNRSVSIFGQNGDDADPLTEI